MNTNFENFRLKLSKISDTVTERSYYPLICEFIQNFRIGTTATPEESLAGENKNVGFPDITVRRQNEDQVGWWEIKLPNDSLGKDSFQIQFSKYKDALENILFTNLREWQLWQWDQEGKPQKVAEIIFDIENYAIGEEEKLENLLVKFFEYSPYLAKTPKQLALALAKKARFLSKQVEEAIDENDKNSDLTKLKQTFESTLIQDIGIHQFSNMIAETLAYSLFLAFLEHVQRGKNEEITLRTAIDYLPTNVPILADLYSLISKVSKTIPAIYQATQMLLDQLKFSDMEKIYYKLVEHKPGEDPVIQFYEPFLKEYDPKEREARGVYYTPKPVVDFIIRSVDYILREKFGKEKGLADESVHLLDPATGTGTFLMSAIQQIHENVKKENINQGEEMVQKEFNKIVINHILKHFYGFELMVAPYAIAHLKLTLLLENLGFNFEMTKNDDDPDNDRFKVYLANTLDDPERRGEQGKASTDFGAVAFPAIPDESEKARLVKKNAPILVVTGNPPYSGISQNPVDMVVTEIIKNKERKKIVKTWIGDLIEDYKYTNGNRLTGEYFNEKKHWLGDDYVKFIRFSQWKITQTGNGIIALITNNGFIDNPTFNGMRYQLLNYFDCIYILNLHGNSKRSEFDKLGNKDENIFQQIAGVGTSISFFIKYASSSPKEIYHAELFGTRISKWEKLVSSDIERIKWTRLEPKPKQFYFIPRNTSLDEEYDKFVKVTDIFSLNSTGIQTSRDKLVIDFEQEDLSKKINMFFDTTITDQEIRSTFFGNKKAGKYHSGDSRNWSLSETRKYIVDPNHENFIKSYQYHAFDYRYIYFDKKMIDWPRMGVMEHLANKENIALLLPRQSAINSYRHVFCTNTLSDMCVVSDKTKEANVVFPLLLECKPSLFQTHENQFNLNENTVKIISKILDLHYLNLSGSSDNNSFSGLDLFYYVYSVLYCPSFRLRYETQLTRDFPRLPFTSDKKLFRKLVRLGNQLVNLHLLGENPLDKSKTIFDEPEKWNVKIGGTKPENVEDWKITEVRYEEKDKRVYVNPGQYFEGIEKEVWDFMIGGYQVCEKWLKDRKKAERKLDTDDLKHYMKIVVSLRETIRIMKEIDVVIPEWPIK